MPYDGPPRVRSSVTRFSSNRRSIRANRFAKGLSEISARFDPRLTADEQEHSVFRSDRFPKAIGFSTQKKKQEYFAGLLKAILRTEWDEGKLRMNRWRIRCECVYVRVRMSEEWKEEQVEKRTESARKVYYVAQYEFKV